MKRHAPAWAHRPASCTMTLLRLCLQVDPLTREVCFLDHCDISEPAGEPIFVSGHTARHKLLPVTDIMGQVAFIASLFGVAA
jgi:hypothetical protein